MSASESRIDLQIDVFALGQQHARVLPSLMPAALVAAVLSEFRELDFLGNQPDAYELRRADGGLIEQHIAIGEQFAPHEHLVFKEKEVEPALPEGTQWSSTRLYLREPASGTVYRVVWLPAIIGRSDPNLPHEDRLAADLGRFENGTAVSRRHAQIAEVDRQIVITALGPNPTVVQAADGTTVTIGTNAHPLHSGDVIMLAQSGIILNVIVRATEEQP